jgi:hypothetical protein
MHHTSIPIEEHLSTQGATAATSREAFFCQSHLERECEFFCRDCEELVCALCAATTHKDHDCVPLEQELGTSRGVVIAAAVPTVRAFSSITEARAHCQQLRLELEQHKVKGNEVIDKMFRTIQQACITRKKEFKAIFEAEVTRKVDLFDECIAKLKEHCDHSQEGLRLVKRMLDHATPTQLLGVRKTLVAGLARLEKHELDTAPECNEVVVVLPQSLDVVLEGLKSVGIIAHEA